MDSRRVVLATVWALALWGTPSAASAQALPPLTDDCQLTLEDDPERVTVETPLGDLTLQLFPSVAPQTVDNFFGYIGRGDYADTLVHRIVLPGEAGLPGGVIQMGGFAYADDTFFRIETQTPIPNEVCISNVAGTIAMAKPSGGLATSQWYVNLDDNTGLDTTNSGFTVFGRVLEGLDVAVDIVNLTDEPSTLLLFLTEVEAGVEAIFLDTPMLAPLAGPTPGSCFDLSQLGVVLVEDPVSPNDWEPGTVQDQPFALVSTACAGMGSGGDPAYACTAPGRRVVVIDPDSGSFVPDPGAPFGVAEVLLACDDLAASDAGFATRLAGLGGELEDAFVGTTYLVPEPGLATSATAALLGVVLLARGSRSRRG